MSEAPAAVEVSGLVKHFGSATALNGLDFVVEEGRSLAIFGPNGAGKTTLMRVLATLARPSGGKVRIRGAETTQAPAALRRGIGFVTHRSLLYPALSALDNVIFFARMFSVTEAEERSRAILSTLGLEHRMHDALETYSRGMEQRCAIARALVHDPAILLLDEPFSGLDAEARETLTEILRRSRGRRTLVLTTHDLALGTGLADEVAVLYRGRLAAHTAVEDIADGDVATLYRRCVRNDRR